MKIFVKYNIFHFLIAYFYSASDYIVVNKADWSTSSVKVESIAFIGRLRGHRSNILVIANGHQTPTLTLTYLTGGRSHTHISVESH